MAAVPTLPLSATEPTLEEVLLGCKRCATCGTRPAPFGFGCSVLRDRPGSWFCLAHRADGDRGVRAQP